MVLLFSRRHIILRSSNVGSLVTFRMLLCGKPAKSSADVYAFMVGIMRDVVAPCYGCAHCL
jgi:hypothetical protein